MPEQTDGGHTCRRPTSCCCRADSLDPSEDCPVHGAGEWPRRCGECGRFMFWQEPKEEEKE